MSLFKPLSPETYRFYYYGTMANARQLYLSKGGGGGGRVQESICELWVQVIQGKMTFFVWSSSNRQRHKHFQYQTIHSSLPSVRGTGNS